MTDTTLELEMAPSDYTKEIWDKEFLCTFSVELGEDKLSTKMVVENKGEEAFDFQAALHSYFTVSSMANLEIAGSFEGKEFLNKMVGDDGEMQTEDRSTITISEEYDRVYKGVNDPVLKDSGTGKTVRETRKVAMAIMLCMATFCLFSHWKPCDALFHVIVVGTQYGRMGGYRVVESIWQ